ncbi:MAG: tungstate ABC transporter substrate-binding protein WtpA [Candidatus Bathyarchaeia archaeon]
MKRARIALVLITVILASSLVYSVIYFSMPNGKVALKVLCADSLLYPLERVETAFESSHPNVDVELEGHGSIQVIRQVTELGAEADVLMVADCSLIPSMMYNTTMPGTNQSYADYYIRFAGNSIVLAYTNQSKYAGEINSTNWYSILMRPDVKFGFPNPLIDALGYRALMTIQLAETYYGNNTIFHELVTDNFDPPISSVPDGSNFTIIVPAVQVPKGDNVVMRASSVELIPLLQSGSIDYCFLYMSNARQYGLGYVELPDEINLGNHQYEQDYQCVAVTFEQQRFATVNMDREGETVYFGLTIPANARHPDVAVEFVKFVLSQEGKDVFQSCWQPVFEPSFTDNLTAVPLGLRSLLAEESS